MKRLLVLLLCLASPAFAAITYVGSGAVSSTGGTVSPAIPAGSVGDLIVCWAALRKNTFTLPTPSGASYTELASGSTYTYHKVWARIATGTDTFTLASPAGTLNTACSRFAGTSTNLASIVDVTGTSLHTALTVRFPAITPATDGDVLFYTTRADSPGAGTSLATPTSFTEVNDTIYTTANLLTSSGYWIQTTATASVQQDLTITPTPSATHSETAIVLALTAAATVSTPTITNVNTTNTFTSTATGLVITGTNFGASQGTGSVNIIDGANTCAQAVTSWGATSITFSAALGDCRYGTRTVQVINGTGGAATIGVILTAPTGKCYFDTGTLLQPFTLDAFGAPNRFGEFSPNDITDNSQLELSSLTFTGASSCANITINTDGSYKVPVDLTTVTWLWNNGTGGWQDTGVSRIGQGKVHIAENNGFRISCSNNTPGTSSPVRSTANKSICASGCDFANTTSGIQNCMAAISAGQSCEMRSGTTDGSIDRWAAQIALTSVTGTTGNPKTLRVQDGDTIELTMATGGTTPLLSLTNVNNVNIQGNSTGQSGLIIGDKTLWAFTCAQSASSPTFSGITNCYPNGKNTVITGSSNVGLMNMTLRGAGSAIASEFDNASDYIYLRQDFVDLHGVNDNKAASSPAENGNLLNVNADHFMAEETVFSHGGVSALKVTGSFAILRRVMGDGSWDDLTGEAVYSGTDPIQIAPNDCSLGTYGCAPYGPILIEDSEIINSGLTPSNPDYNVAIRLNGLGVIFRRNYIYSNTNNYLLNLCGSNDHSATAYSEGEQAVYNNTFWGGASFWTAAAGYPAGISVNICQNAIIADNLFQGAEPGLKSAAEVYAFTAGLNGVPKGTATNQWKGWTVFSNIFGVDPNNPSLNMQVTLTGTGAATKLLTDSATWSSNFYNNRNVTLNWANGLPIPGESRQGLVISTTSAAGVGDNAPITVTTSSGAPSATVVVASARPFKDDWGFNNHTFGGFHTEYGDCIAIGPLTTSTIVEAIPVRIATSGVNYSTNTLTVISTMTFQVGSPVWKAIDNGDGSCGRAYQNRGAAQ